ncbi:LysR family transcriptional regulator [Gulosibacter sp. 10]|uniref:LysR family transcriptional regulator n=1 Tax=Gulosibacter sp. 10 TaxID=1255570 RepID=UPI00097E9225|nr:LysR family transcriptional regulator [Gulosibacter sp. 10]SJM71130.1 transcriptional regulator, LysR family [Gulosibacter sp. 10]
MSRRDEQLEWLESFLAVAEHRSFSDASLALHRSQSRVSAHVAALERTLSATLFDRRHRPVQLTDAGEAYLPFARGALQSLDDGGEAVANLSEEIRGVVVVGGHVSASAGFLVGIIAKLRETHPQVEVQLTEGTTNALTDKLLAGTINIAIRNSWPVQPELELAHRVLWQEPFVVVLPPGHELLELPEPIAPEHLAGRRIISIGRPGKQIEPEIGRVVDDWGIDVEFAQQTEQPQTVVNMVKAGLGIGLINALAMEVSDTTGLHARRAGREHDGRSVGVWWDPDRYQSAATRLVLERILAEPIPATMLEPR